MPRAFALLTGEPASPRHAIAAVAALVAALALSGDVKLTWSFSAFSVLVYYAITNLAALRLPAGARRPPRSVAAAGLASCLGLAFWVEPRAWGAGAALVALGLAWHALARRRAATAS
jgi:APA family basic amino acid/polyamine antiporter